jgi:hypothetical protein
MNAGKLTVPDNAMTRQNTKTIGIHNLHLVIRDFPSSVTVLNYRVRHHYRGVSFASFVARAGNRGADLGLPASAIGTCASFITTKAVAHLFHIPARERSCVSPVRCQTKRKYEIWW